jgi:Glyoxalase/Bleomycin resistance protein/Dioxygenase superfamily
MVDDQEKALKFYTGVFGFVTNRIRICLDAATSG